MPIYTTAELFDLSQTLARPLLEGTRYPWQALEHISTFICQLGAGLSASEYDNPSENVWISKSASVAPSAHIGGPCIIQKGAEVRHCAYIRGNALVGENAVVGNSTELKNVILFNGVQVPHYNYVGDSILGYKAHMGAGSIASNVRADKGSVSVKGDTDIVQTGLKKMGTILADYAEVGCNAVLCPGSVVGKNATVYPLSCVRGTVPHNTIFKNKGTLAQKA